MTKQLTSLVPLKVVYTIVVDSFPFQNQRSHQIFLITKQLTSLVPLKLFISQQSVSFRPKGPKFLVLECLQIKNLKFYNNHNRLTTCWDVTCARASKWWYYGLTQLIGCVGLIIGLLIPRRGLNHVTLAKASSKFTIKKSFLYFLFYFLLLLINNIKQ